MKVFQPKGIIREMVKISMPLFGKCNIFR